MYCKGEATGWTWDKGKWPGNEGETGDGTEQMRARDVTACACCGFVMFREKGKENHERGKHVYILSQCVCVCVCVSFAYAVALSACYSFIKQVSWPYSTCFIATEKNSVAV
jgi:uncharacterized membrane protein